MTLFISKSQHLTSLSSPALKSHKENADWHQIDLNLCRRGPIKPIKYAQNRRLIQYRSHRNSSPLLVRESNPPEKIRMSGRYCESTDSGDVTSQRQFESATRQVPNFNRSITGSWRLKTKTISYIFIESSSHLYKRVCRSVHTSVTVSLLKYHADDASSYPPGLVLHYCIPFYILLTTKSGVTIYFLHLFLFAFFSFFLIRFCYIARWVTFVIPFLVSGFPEDQNSIAYDFSLRLSFLVITWDEKCNFFIIVLPAVCPPALE